MNRMDNSAIKIHQRVQTFCKNLCPFFSNHQIARIAPFETVKMVNILNNQLHQLEPASEMRQRTTHGIIFACTLV